MFPTARITPLFPSWSRARALDRWRDAAGVVATRWQRFLDAQPESRTFAFASYLAALDAEESAAAELAAQPPSIAA